MAAAGGAQSALQAKQPFLLKVAIHARHRVGVDAERNGKLAHGRERVARGQCAAPHEQTDLLGQLHVDGKRASRSILKRPGTGACWQKY